MGAEGGRSSSLGLIPRELCAVRAMSLARTIGWRA